MGKNILLNFLSSRWLLCICLLLILVGVNVCTLGMFADGQQYAAIAKHLAEGKGTFWYPYLYDGWAGYKDGIFIEQPQLGYLIESAWFKLLPTNYLYTEKIFCFCMCILTAWLIAKCWAIVNDVKLAWLPISIWILIPTCFWSYNNNVLEIIMAVFTTLSVYLFLIVVYKNNNWWYLLLGAVSIFCAAFVKGVPGLFTLSLPFLFAIITKRIAIMQALKISIAQLFVLIVLISLFYFLNADAKTTWHYYIIERLIGRIKNTPTTQNRFFILGSLLNDLLLPLIITALLFFRKKLERNNIAYFFLAAGFAGSLPIMLTKVQRPFYVTQSFPLFAIGFALLMVPVVNVLLNKVAVTKLLVVINSIAVVITIFLFAHNLNGYARDKDLIKDIQQIGALCPKEKHITAPISLQEEYNMRFCFKRFYGINIMYYDTLNKYAIAEANTQLPNCLYKGKMISLFKK